MPVVRLTVKAAVLYFALVFAVGFVLGTIRTLWVVPSLGERNAQLTEAPLMVGLSFAAARWVSRRLALPDAATLRMGVGLLALAFMLVIEFHGRALDPWSDF